MNESVTAQEAKEAIRAIQAIIVDPSPTITVYFDGKPHTASWDSTCLVSRGWLEGLIPLLENVR